MKIKNGDIVKLKPLTELAKQKIDQQGEKWIVEAITENILFDERTGIWLGLRSKSGNDNEFIWVNLTDDDNFEVLI